jgi:peptidoglycan hydrolase CwlO-like protein
LSEQLEHEQGEYDRVNKKVKQYRNRVDDALDEVSAQTKKAEENAKKAEESAAQVAALQKELKRVKTERNAMQSELDGYKYDVRPLLYISLNLANR